MTTTYLASDGSLFHMTHEWASQPKPGPDDWTWQEDSSEDNHGTGCTAEDCIEQIEERIEEA